MKVMRCAISMVLIVMLIIAVSAVVVLPKYRISSQFEILDGEGVDGFMMINDNRLLSYLANFDLLALELDKRITMFDSEHGLIRCETSFPWIYMCLNPQAIRFTDVKRCMKPFRGTSRFLGTVDDKLELQHVVSVYGELPKIDYESFLQHPFLPFLLIISKSRYPVRIQNPTNANGRTSATIEYWDRGISFDSSGAYVTGIQIYSPQKFDTNLVFRAGHVVIGDEKDIDIGRIVYPKEIECFVVELKNGTMYEICLRVNRKSDSGVFACLGTTKLSPSESTILVWFADGNKTATEMSFCVNLDCDMADKGQQDISLHGVLAGAEVCDRLRNENVDEDSN